MNRPRLPVRSFAVVSLFAVVASAQTSVPATMPADPAVDAMLDRLHDVGTSLKTLRADVAMTTENAGTGANSTRSGMILIERRGEEDTRAHVDFTSLDSEVGGKLRRIAEHVEYLLDGDWVTDRVYRKPGAPATVPNRETKRQIRPAGTKTNLLKLGAGPFPLPIGQPKEVVRQQFDVAATSADADHPGLAGVTLTPRDGTSLAKQFHSIIVWLAPADSMPSVIETWNKDESEKKTTTLSHVALNGAVTDADFALPAIADPSQWKLETVPYQP